MTTRRPTKAIIPAAGFGTRFLPQTKAMPKEMLPLVDKPIIQYVVEQLVAAGVKDIILVTGQNKRSIEDHFDAPTQDLVTNLKMGGAKKQHFIDEINAIAQLANFVYVRQRPVYGNGIPLLDVEHLIGDEPFFYVWSDDLVLSTPSCFDQMLAAYDEYQAPIICSVRVTDDEGFKQYGFAGGKELKPGVIDVNAIVEKPGSRESSPSDLASCKGFILTPDIFAYLHQAENDRAHGKELYMNDALIRMMHDNKRIIACETQNGSWYDAGDKLSYLKTVVDFALMRDDIGPAFAAYLRTCLGGLDK
ncbi:MAG TPA: sugar phosphate nucleotidyltransferase [Patescibacteria group bacterium]|nr:sugar phosphate nucleotidyltransferase [Patescibacteria group bacterium]